MTALTISIQADRFAPEELAPAADALRAGGLVVFPTETLYGLGCAADSAEARGRVFAVKGRPEDKPLARYLHGPFDLYDLAAVVPSRAARLARALWPGPVTLVLSDGSGGSTGYRCSSHPVPRLLAAAEGGLVGTSANLSGGPDPRAPGDVPPAVRDGAAVLIWAGPTPLGKPSTVVEVGDRGLRVHREGAVSRTAVAYFDHFAVVFVCTGNTCRSPMAAAMLRLRVARKLGVPVDALPDTGIVIESAGTSAYSGAFASAHAVAAVERAGGELRSHRSSPVTAQLILEADRTVALTRGHLRTLQNTAPAAAERIRLLDAGGGDVADPIGGDLATYERTLSHIDGQLARLAEEIVAWHRNRKKEDT